MENNELLDLLEQEYLQEYRKIQNRLLKKIRKSSYLNVELHDIANQLYTAQLRRLKPQDIYNGDEAAFINGIVRSVPEPLLLKNKKSKAGNRAVIIEASGEFSTQGGSIVSVVSHDIEKKHKAYELEGSVNVILDSGMQELPWMYLSVNKTKNKDEYGFRLSKALVAGQSSVKLQLKDLVKTTWTHK